MVYCGKASENCQNCRRRRIKCDKLRPECSQCIRQSKKCPGYRDQLSLMFRDESTKVVQKAQARWSQGGNEQGERLGNGLHPLALASSSGTSSPSLPGEMPLRLSAPPCTSSHDPTTSPITPSVPGGGSTPLVDRTRVPVTRTSGSPTTKKTAARAAADSNNAQVVVRQEPDEGVPRLVHLGRSLEERGVEFYMEHYMLGLPDEPKSLTELSSSHWSYNSSLRHVMAAIGLVSLSNLTDNADMISVAREQYGQALRDIGQMIRPGHQPSLEVTMRSVIMLAMFEVVKGTHHTHGTVYTHVLGGSAVLHAWLPLSDVPFRGVRILTHLIYSTFIVGQLTAANVSPQILDCISTAAKLQHETDKPATDLALLIIRYMQLYAFADKHILSDGKPQTANFIHQLLSIDAEMAGWASSLTENWTCSIVKAPQLPSRAVFKGEYHLYFDIMTARTWNFYRWARILVNQMLSDLIDKNPTSSVALVSAARQAQMFKNIRSLARDTLASTPSHWQHPLLRHEARITAQNGGGAGAGASGVPALIFQLKVASCAPCVPSEYRHWTLDILQAIWGTTGMLYARTIREAIWAHEDSVRRNRAEGVLAEE